MGSTDSRADAATALTARARLRAVLRSLWFSARRIVQRIGQFPGDVHAAIYTALRLNRLYHRLGASPEVQLRLMPSRLPVSRRLMAQPYRVPLHTIRWGGRPAGGEQRKGRGLGCGLVFDGDWDLEDRRDIATYLDDYIYSRTVHELWRDGLPRERTAQYREMVSFVDRGLYKEWQARGCRTRADVDAYFDAMANTYDAIGTDGYRSQAELGSPHWFDEIKVFVGRDGALHKLQGAGHHRLAMARLAGVHDVPVIVIGMHRDWVLAMQARHGQDVISAADRALCELGNVVGRVAAPSQ